MPYLNFENKMIFMKIKKPLITHFAELNRQAAALYRKVIRKLLPRKGNIKFVFPEPLGFGGKI